MSARSCPAVTERPLLYSFRRCPYAMRARMALLVSGTVCEIREVLLADKPSEMVEASPKATVPVCVLPNGEVLEESLAIMRWALDRNDPEGWLGGDEVATAALIATNDGPLKHHLDRYKYATRHDSDPLEHRAAGAAILRDLDARLDRQSHLCGDQRTLADIAIMPFVRQFAATDRDWFDAQPLGSLQRWLARLLGSDLFAAAMVKLPQWRSGDPVTLFPGAIAEG